MYTYTPGSSGLHGGVENHIPCYFDETQKPNTTQYGDPHDRHYVHVNENELQDPHRNHKAVETVKEGHEVRWQPHCVHLQKHLHRKQRQQHLIGIVCK